jgi:hypothetical protein
MTTKRSFASVLNEPIKSRIVIELQPGGGSLLKTYGPVTMPQVIDALMAQMSSVWAKWITTMTTALTDPNTGQPAVKTPESTPMQSESEEFKEEPIQ